MLHMPKDERNTVESAYPPTHVNIASGRVWAPVALPDCRDGTEARLSLQHVVGQAPLVNTCQRDGIKKKTTAVREFRLCPTTSSRCTPFPSPLSKELVGTARKACELATPLSCFACAIDEAAGDSPWSRRHLSLRRLGRQATSRDPPSKTKLTSGVYGHTTTHTLKMGWSGKWRCG